MGQPEFRLCLLQPDAHFHLAVHPGRGCQVLLGPDCVPSATVEVAQAEVAVGGERAHSERACNATRLVIEALGFRNIQNVRV
jgi:hypothetical protein